MKKTFIAIAALVLSAGIYMLAQSYMPAQDIHLLQNFSNPSLSPWYSVKESSIIQTPQWIFYTNQLKTW